MSNSSYSEGSAQGFKPYLFAGERALWSGRPQQGLAFTGRDIFLVPFSLLWCGFVIFWNVGVSSIPGDGPPLIFQLFGLTFLAVGLYFVAGRFFHDAHVRKNMRYAVTDQRVLVLRGSKITSLDIHRLPRLELSEHRDGSGTLTFEAVSFGPWAGMNGFSWWVPSLSSATQFFRIKEPRRVYELVRNAALRADG